MNGKGGGFTRSAPPFFNVAARPDQLVAVPSVLPAIFSANA